MLQKTFKRKRAVWVAAVALPLLAILVYFFSNTIYAQKREVVSETINATDTIPPQPYSKQKSLRPPLIVNDTTGEKSISKEEMREYEDIIKEMTVKRDGRTEYRYIDGKTQTAVEIYKRMSAEQRKTATPLPPPPPPPPSPPAEQKGATGNEIAEYKAILKEMRVEHEDGHKSYKFIDGKTQRAVEIHKKMTEEQRTGVEMLPPPPPPTKARNETKEVVVIGRPGSNQDLKPKKSTSSLLKEVTVVGYPMKKRDTTKPPPPPVSSSPSQKRIT